MDFMNMDEPILIAQSGPLNGQRWGLVDELVMGRDDSCQIVIPDRQVSRFHARVRLTKDGVHLEDLASKNGTFVNGSQIENSIFLQDSDVIQIALVQSFVYLSSDATLPLGAGMPVVAGQNSATRQYRLVLDKLSRRVWLDQQEILPPLSVPQFRLLEALFDQNGGVVSRQDLVVAVWGDQEAVGVSEQALDALVRRLRDRLFAYDTQHTYLVTVRGYGLRLDNPEIY